VECVRAKRPVLGDWKISNARRQMPICVMVKMSGHAELLQIVGAVGAARSLAGRLNGRQQQRDQDADDCNHHQKFDEGKTV
jgi:hypothetical protein